MIWKDLMYFSRLFGEYFNLFEILWILCNYFGLFEKLFEILHYWRIISNFLEIIWFIVCNYLGNYLWIAFGYFKNDLGLFTDYLRLFRKIIWDYFHNFSDYLQLILTLFEELLSCTSALICDDWEPALWSQASLATRCFPGHAECSSCSLITHSHSQSPSVSGLCSWATWMLVVMVVMSWPTLCTAQNNNPI